jgi:RHS repeat-associated protein
VHYIPGGDGICAIAVKEGNSAFNFYVPYTDHLGSIVTVTNSSGTVVAEQNLDAWGRNRQPNTWNYGVLPVNPMWLYRGYTGHEQLNEFNLINMNARLYDPTVGRMLIPDNYVSVGGSQGLNRYTYAYNNPLKYTDPNGNWIQAAIGAVMGAYSGYQIAHSKGITGLGMAIYMFSVEKRKFELKRSFLSFKSYASYFKNFQSGNC